ncbi:elongation factor 4 [Candidatus Parcubacteria bacterium]|nr:elongation factor 4 [Candidatus Parcubacteria bacterium]
MQHIRNFSIIAHIDHGKSTLADRMLEITHTIEKRKMMNQVLDSMELERERGITIKMQPVRMKYKLDGQDYILNLIDTPGHIDFSYEVSRALKAVEGSLLLVDATQGVQAQTLTTLGMARESHLKIIPVLTKIDSPLAQPEKVREEVAKLLNCPKEEILEVSGRTGEGVENLLKEIVRLIPPPKIPEESMQNFAQASSTKNLRSLVFDFQYSNHKGVVVYVRVISGSVSRNTPLQFKIAGGKFNAIEVGTFSPTQTPCESLNAGEIGYIVTGIKESGIASVGDTVAGQNDILAPLAGYMSPRPVVWSSIYPESQDDFMELSQALGKLRLSDSSFTFEEESSGTLGRGFRCGFLGMLHLEIITERLRREFNLNLVVATPSITYEVIYRDGKKEMVYSPAKFPEEHLVESVMEPWVNVTIITPADYLSPILQILYDHEAVVGETDSFGDDRMQIHMEMPLRELMKNFFDTIKSVSSGFASLSYEMKDMRPADVVKLEILVAEEPIAAFSRVVSRRTVEVEAEQAVEKLSKILPRQMITTKIQGKALGRIISSRTLTAMRKDVTQHMYGGDITRKMKLREKQKKGKKKMQSLGKVNIPNDVFLKMVKSE